MADRDLDAGVIGGNEYAALAARSGEDGSNSLVGGLRSHGVHIWCPVGPASPGVMGVRPTARGVKCDRRPER